MYVSMFVWYVYMLLPLTSALQAPIGPVHLSDGLRPAEGLGKNSSRWAPASRHPQTTVILQNIVL